MEQKRPADIFQELLDYLWNGLGPVSYTHLDVYKRQDEAYLFIPFDEDYYQAMAEVIEERFENWQEQDFDEDTLEPSEVAHAIMEYLDCECTYFPSMADDLSLIHISGGPGAGGTVLGAGQDGRSQADCPP